jgi:hypothetical protein
MTAFREAVEVSGMVEHRVDREPARTPDINDMRTAVEPGPAPIIEERGGKKVIVERRFDAGDMRLVDLGQKIESGIRQGVAISPNSPPVSDHRRERRPLTEEEIIRRRIERRDRSRRGVFGGLVHRRQRDPVVDLANTPDLMAQISADQ